jgi:hypothetical protein
MKCAVGSLTLLQLCLFAAAALSQVVIIGANGKSGPPPGTPEYCADVEPLRPNLVLWVDTTVRGRVIDQTTAPLKDSPIELRRFFSAAKQQRIKKLLTDADGKFDLGVVKRGEYRLLLAPNRAFKQPEKLECSSSKCSLETVLIVSPSDQLASSGPIR